MQSGGDRYSTVVTARTKGEALRRGKKLVRRKNDLGKSVYLKKRGLKKLDDE